MRHWWAPRQGTRGGNATGRVLTGMRSHVLPEPIVKCRAAMPAVRPERPACGHRVGRCRMVKGRAHEEKRVLISNGGEETDLIHLM